MRSKLVRHEIQVLLRAGHGPTDVAARVGVSVRTVRRVAAEGAVTNADGGLERPERKGGRPSKATPFAPKVSAWLATEPSLSTEELLRRAIDSGYCGHKTAFYALVAAVRPPRPTPAARFDGLPGQFSQHDFGQVDVRFLDGRTKRVRFFASRLTYSRFVAMTLVDDERTETIVGCLERHFVAFGGLPLLAVFDRPNATAKSRPKGRDVEAWNSTFARAIIHIGVGVEMRAPRGSPERLVVWVRSAFFKHRRFRDQADLDAQLDAWLVEVNTKTPSSKTNEIPEIRRLEELVRLRPIKVPR